MKKVKTYSTKLALDKENIGTFRSNHSNNANPTKTIITLCPYLCTVLCPDTYTCQKDF